MPLGLVKLAYAEEKISPYFRIGPYPISYEIEGIRTHSWATLIFYPTIKDRTLDEIQLHINLFLQMDNLPSVAEEIVRRKSDNCARYNVDNWTYNLNKKDLLVTSPTSLKFHLEGSLTSWACSPGLPETVVETCDNGMFEYPCPKLRSGSAIKTKLLYQGFNLYKEIRMEIKDNKIIVSEKDPTIYLDNSNPLSPILNLLVFVTNTFPALISNLYQEPQSIINQKLPEELKQINAKFNHAGFVNIENVPFATIHTSIGVNREQLNKVMRDHFGDIWTDLLGLPPTKRDMTKSLMKNQCLELLPNDSLEECSAKLGWPYELLPE